MRVFNAAVLELACETPWDTESLAGPGTAGDDLAVPTGPACGVDVGETFCAGVAPLVLGFVLAPVAEGTLGNVAMPRGLRITRSHYITRYYVSSVFLGVLTRSISTRSTPQYYPSTIVKSLVFSMMLRNVAPIITRNYFADR